MNQIMLGQLAISNGGSLVRTACYKLDSRQIKNLDVQKFNVKTTIKIS